MGAREHLERCAYSNVCCKLHAGSRNCVWTSRGCIQLRFWCSFGSSAYWPAFSLSAIGRYPSYTSRRMNDASNDVDQQNSRLYAFACASRAVTDARSSLSLSSRIYASH